MPEAEMNIAEENEALIQFLYMAPVGLAQTSIDGEIQMINPISAQLLMPLSDDGNLTNLFTALGKVAPDLRDRVASFGERSGKVCDALTIRLNAGERGKSDPQMLSITLMKLDDRRLMAVLTDITQQISRERLLKKNEAWLNAILTGITDYALVSLDPDGVVNDWNESILRVTGFGKEDVLGKPFSMFYPEDAITRDRIRDRLCEADDDGWSIDQGWRIRNDGTRFWGSALIAPLRQRPVGTAAGVHLTDGRDDSAYCLILRDITDKREASEALRKDIACDHLTGIANRRTFFEAAELELERGKRLPREISMIMFDIDSFKLINDTYGHPTGDAVLRHLAGLLSATFRQVDVVARLGGEEFAALLPSTGVQHAAAVANRLRQVVEANPLVTEAGRIAYTVSGGVAGVDGELKGLDSLIRRADVALYAAKREGRNRVQAWSPQLQRLATPEPAAGR